MTTIADSEVQDKILELEAHLRRANLRADDAESKLQSRLEHVQGMRNELDGYRAKHDLAPPRDYDLTVWMEDGKFAQRTSEAAPVEYDNATWRKHFLARQAEVMRNERVTPEPYGPTEPPHKYDIGKYSVMLYDDEGCEGHSEEVFTGLIDAISAVERWREDTGGTGVVVRCVYNSVIKGRHALAGSSKV